MGRCYDGARANASRAGSGMEMLGSTVTRALGFAAALMIAASSWAADAPLLHPRYHLPASSFAYVGDAADPATWKLPYRHADGGVDARRLPLAIEAMVGTYRGRRAAVPASARHDVLERLAQAADEIGRMPPKAAHPAPLYRQLAAALGAR
jgi:hypothetical protein